MTFKEYNQKLEDLIKARTAQVTKDQEKIKALEESAKDKIKDIAAKIDELRKAINENIQALNELSVLYYKTQGVVEYVDGDIVIEAQDVPAGGSDPVNVSEG
jgi:hypothetical protein